MTFSAPFFFFSKCFQRKESQTHSSRCFSLRGSTTHSSYYPPLPLPLPTLHPLSCIPPKHLGLAFSWSQFGFPSKKPFHSSCCKPQISKAMSFSNPSFLLAGCRESRRGKKKSEKKNKLFFGITNILFLPKLRSRMFRSWTRSPSGQDPWKFIRWRWFAPFKELCNWVSQCWTLLSIPRWIHCLV